MPRPVAHGGAPKTTTTYIQLSSFDKDKVLCQHGAYLPKSGRFQFAHNSVAHRHLGWEYVDIQRFREDAGGCDAAVAEVGRLKTSRVAASGARGLSWRKDRFRDRDWNPAQASRAAARFEGSSRRFALSAWGDGAVGELPLSRPRRIARLVDQRAGELAAFQRYIGSMKRRCLKLGHQGGAPTPENDEDNDNDSGRPSAGTRKR